MPPLHVFIDESGDFVFSPQGTKYFLLSAVSTMDCRDLYADYWSYSKIARAVRTEFDVFAAGTTEYY